MPTFTRVKADDQPLSVRLWAGIDDIYAAILAHPFIAGLTDGSLEREAFRFYWEVGKTLLRRGSPDPLYRRCIETYGGEEFAAVVQAVLALADRLGPQLAPADEARMHERFRTTSRYEWMFWEMGYRREPWPVGSP